jgi:hypothetical protein
MKNGHWILPINYLLSSSEGSLTIQKSHDMGPKALLKALKQVVQQIFIALKIHHPQPCLNMWIMGPMAIMLTIRPPRATTAPRLLNEENNWHKQNNSYWWYLLVWIMLWTCHAKVNMNMHFLQATASLLWHQCDHNFKRMPHILCILFANILQFMSEDSLQK